MIPPDLTPYVADDPFGMTEYDGRPGMVIASENHDLIFQSPEDWASIGGLWKVSRANQWEKISNPRADPAPAEVTGIVYDTETSEADGFTQGDGPANTVTMEYSYEVGVIGGDDVSFETALSSQRLDFFDPTYLWQYLDELRDAGQPTQLPLLRLDLAPGAGEVGSMIEWLGTPSPTVIAWDLTVSAISNSGVYSLDGTESVANPTPANYEPHGTDVPTVGWKASPEGMDLQLGSPGVGEQIDLLDFRAGTDYSDALDTRIGYLGAVAVLHVSEQQYDHFVPDVVGFPFGVGYTNPLDFGYSQRIWVQAPPYRIWVPEEEPAVQIPLRQRQRNDGLGMSSTPRWLGTSSRQASIRWRGYL